MADALSRRAFLRHSAAAAAGIGVLGRAATSARADHHEPLYRISLAQWSLNKRLFGREEPKMDNLDFPAFARSVQIEAVEWVNQFFMDKAADADYLAEMKKRCDDHGVRTLLIMCDREGDLGDPDDQRRRRAVENHHKWVEAAKYLGGHAIRVNAASAGGYEEQMKLAADGLAMLTEFAAGHEMNVIVENHGGLSSNGKWLAGVMKMVDHPRCGTLPDFGNFMVSRDPVEWYDRYQGVRELMPWAKSVSAKSHEFDEDGNEVNTDYRRMMKIVVDAGYRGYVGVEYEGRQHNEKEGILATRRLLERVREELTAARA